MSSSRARKLRLAVPVFLSSIFLLLTSCFLVAQDSATGSLRGIVLDPSGSRVAQASIALVNNANGIRYITPTNAQGEFALELQPGDYSARVEAQGMSPEVTPQLHIDVGGMAQLEFHLKVAGAQEQVTVSAAPPAVETQPSAVSTLLDERAIADFPLNGRRFSDLALFSPGVTQDPRSLTSATNGDLSFGGLRGFQNSYLVDGSDYNNAFFAQARGRYRAPLSFSTEVVQEFRVSSNSYGAEQGRSGGAVVNIVTKSGRTIFTARPSTTPRQFAGRGRILPGIQAAQPPAAGRGHDRRPDQTQQGFLLRRIRSAHFSRSQRRRISERQFAGDSPTGQRTHTLETTRPPTRHWYSRLPRNSRRLPENIPQPSSEILPLRSSTSI